ncbi:MAG: hypothetical protein JXP34_16140 [Planctomycetes bacterium]|nr:hypothetical protein [Planctomycetota bacterium]
MRTNDVVACALLFCLASSAAEAAVPPGEAEWTVMIFLNADNDLETYGIRDFEEMAAVGSSDQLNIVVQFDRGRPDRRDDTSFGDWTHTLRFRITKDMKPTAENAVSSVGEVDMGQGAELADFVRWAKEEYPAKRYLLGIWNHGQGWRTSEAVTVHRRARGGYDWTAQLDLRTKQFQKLNSDHELLDLWKPLNVDQAIAGAVRYVSSDDTSNSHMFNRDMQDSLLAGLDGHKLDVLGFDACLMGMIETGYAMRDVASVMVASEELEPGEGWEYSTWLEALRAQPGMDAAALAKVIVDSYADSYGVANKKFLTLSAVDLGRLPELADAVSRLADACTAGLAGGLQGIRKSRDACSTYGQPYYLHGIDLYRFCEQLDANCDSESICGAATSILGIMAKTVVHSYAGSKRKDEDLYGSHGVAIYFPATGNSFYSDPDHIGYLESNPNYPVQFVQDQRWDNFLRAYYEKLGE